MLRRFPGTVCLRKHAVRSSCSGSRLFVRTIRIPPTHPIQPRHGVPASAPRQGLGAAFSFWQTRRWAKWLSLTALGVATAATVAVAVKVGTDDGADYSEKAQAVVRGVSRSVVTFVTTSSIMLDYKWLHIRHGHRGVESEEYKGLRSLVHQRREAFKAVRRSWRHIQQRYSAHLAIIVQFPAKFRLAAQHVGSLVKMVPKEYTDTLSVLQDKAPFHTFHEVAEVFWSEFGGFPLEFHETPLAAASLAQVHRAVTKDGRECAVKVQYKDVMSNCRVDLWCMDGLTRLVSVLFPEFDLVWIVKEFEQNLAQEFDFRNEAKNAESARQRFAHRAGDFHIPEIYWDLTSSKVLTMEFIKGVRITKVADLQKENIDIPALRKTLIQVFSEMIYVHGIIHCDPHPGNMLVRLNPERSGQTQLVLLDHGLYRTLADDFRRTYCDLWVGILKMDDELLQSAGQRLGPSAEQYWKLFPVMFAGHMRGSGTASMLGDEMTEQERLQIRSSFRNFQLEDAMEFLEGLPRDMLLVMRSLNLVAGVHRALGGSNLPKFKIQAWFAVLGRHWSLQIASCNGLCTKFLHWIFDIPYDPTSTLPTKAGVRRRFIISWLREWIVVWWRLWLGIRFAQANRWINSYFTS